MGLPVSQKTNFQHTHMVDRATLAFIATDGSEVCTLTLIAQGRVDLSLNLSPIEIVAPVIAQDAGEAEVQLLEGMRYEYELTNGFFLELARHYSDSQNIVQQSNLDWREHSGVLNPGLATGRLPLVVVDADGNLKGHACVEVRSRKLNYKNDYQQMLGDITAQCMELLQDLRAPSSFNAIPDPGKDAQTIAQRFAFVRSLLNSPEFDNALHRIITSPHEVWQRVEQSQSISRGFKPSGKLIRQLSQGGRRIDAHHLNNHLPTLPERITVNHAVLNTDTPENRFVKFALRAFRQFLTTMRGSAKLDLSKDARLIAEIDALNLRLDEALSSDVLRRASEPTILPLGSPTLQRRQGYREVLQAWSHFAMAANLSWKGGDDVYAAGQRDVATLYEYWVFFTLLQTVGRVFRIDPKDKLALIEKTGDELGLKLKAGKHIALRGQSIQPGRLLEVKFSYNRSFRATRTPRVPGSWTHNLRPDYTLSLWPAGFSEYEAELQELMVHVHFDAKYRIEQVAELLMRQEGTENKSIDDDELNESLNAEKLEESRGTYKRADLLKMHAYRDAIRRSQGAYVIYPGNSEESKRLTGFHEVLPGLGAFALRPGSGTFELEKFLQDVVRHVADRSSAREQQSFHAFKSSEIQATNIVSDYRVPYRVFPEIMDGANVRHAPPRETFVLVGWVKSEAHLKWIREKGKYNFRMGAAAGALRLSHQVVGATYLLLHGADNKAIPGLFRIKNSDIGPQVHTSDELKAMDYPSTPTQNTYLIYEVERVEHFDRFDWDYGALSNKPDTADAGHPFATNLHALLQVLRPELFPE
jgi:predicted component of viral defense system (DUF524 family)